MAKRDLQLDWCPTVTVLGVHTNSQGKTLEDLISLWRAADDLGYGWISISDHFPGVIGAESNETVVTHAALAVNTIRARCAVLVYAVGFRHPAVIACAASTIDHLSGGRAAVGLGSGAMPRDYEIYGFPYPSTSVRTDMLEEGVQVVAGLLHEEVFSFRGNHFQINEARNYPRPLQERLPVWVGVKGEHRGLRIAARYADGWNLGFETLEVFVRKRKVLYRHCQEVGRDPQEVQCSVNLVLARGDQSKGLSPNLANAALTGSVEEIASRVHQYAEAGADQVNFWLPFPWDYESLATMASTFDLPRA